VGADIDEVFDENLLPFENATETAREKAQNVF
jgi:predicted house-cleaning NTP pyrophosphatase (Maf/HAM1 superfamily)